MKTYRFHAHADQFSEGTVRLDRDQTHHLVRVLRLGVGQEVRIFDGEDHEFQCVVESLAGDRAELAVKERILGVVESPAGITLVQALLKGEKFDWIVQKATELGVARILPLVTEHSDVRLRADQAAARLERWRKISLESMKQCGRRRLVEFMVPIETQALGRVPQVTGGPVLVFNERGGAWVPDILNPAMDRDCTVVIGPEGGWSESELLSLASSGGRFVTLGPRILRAETAAITAIVIVQHLLGDLSREASPAG